MPTPTYIPLATVTLGSSASSVTFSSIPATYRDLVLVLNSKVVLGFGFPRARLNADSGSNYSRVIMSGNGSTTSSSSATVSFITVAGDSGADADGLNFNSITQFMDYSATDKHTTVLSRANNAGIATTATASRWANTAAVTSMEILLDSGSYATGSTFALYGIAS